LLLNAMSIRLNGPKAIDYRFKINWNIEDTDERCHTELNNSVLMNREGLCDDADITITLSRTTLNEIVLGEADLSILDSGNSNIVGDSTVISNLDDMLDRLPEVFPVVTHDLKNEEC